MRLTTLGLPGQIGFSDALTASENDELKWPSAVVNTNDVPEPSARTHRVIV